MTKEFIEMLNDIDVDKKESHHISNTIKCLGKIPVAEDREKAILECRKAINLLRKVTSVDTDEARLMLDNSLVILQR